VVSSITTWYGINHTERAPRPVGYRRNSASPRGDGAPRDQKFHFLRLGAVALFEDAEARELRFMRLLLRSSLPSLCFDRFLRFGEMDVQHTVLESGAGLAVVNPFGSGEAAEETAVRALDPVVCFVLFFFLELALASDGQAA